MRRSLALLCPLTGKTDTQGTKCSLPQPGNCFQQRAGRFLTTFSAAERCGIHRNISSAQPGPSPPMRISPRTPGLSHNRRQPPPPVCSTCPRPRLCPPTGSFCNCCPPACGPLPCTSRPTTPTSGATTPRAAVS